ncbi:hypothetical protein COY27_05455 [Candidatus Woesearchaeota archaeon CG_4_10_14_0_2_um_filter_33_13]|nr:MAG: hypothetical protein COY27_05455 [Candidatus Woesearchaeota archaeon CG_4_10_14_0_2_um_filter_33_13]
MKIRSKLIIGFLTVIALFVFALLLVITTTENKFADNINTNLKHINRQMMHDIEKTIEFRVQRWREFVITPLVVDTVSKSNQEFDDIQGVSALIQQRDQEWVNASNETITPLMEGLLNNDLSQRIKVRQLFYERDQSYPVFPEVFLTNKYGAVIAMTGKITDYYQADEFWWKEAKAEGSYVGDVEYDASSETYSLVIALSVYDTNNNFSGVLKLLIDTQDFFKDFEEKIIVEYLSLGQYVDFTLLDNQHRIIHKKGNFTMLEEVSAEERKELEMLEQHQTPYLILDNNASGIDKKLVVQSRSKIINVGKPVDLGWNLILEYNQDQLLSPVAGLKSDLFIISIVVTILSLYLGIVISRSLSSSIHQLHKATEEMEKGNLNVKVDIKTKDEVHQLGKAFNHMINQMKEQQQLLIKSETEKRNFLEKSKKELEFKVKSRTADLEKSRVATLNILDDVEEARKKLKDSYVKLKGLEQLKTQFLSFASHELRTPLTPITAQLQRLLSQDLPKKERIASLDMVLRNVTRLDRLINDVLDISRIESKRLKLAKSKNDLNEDLVLIISTATPLATNQGMKLIYTPTKLPKFMYDKYRIQQVLTNLIDNAIKHSAGKNITISAKLKRDKINVCVKDDGEGIKEEDFKHLFELFYVGQEGQFHAKGAGLGLSICKGIVEEHGGKFTVNTRIGQGSMFCFTLPFVQKEASLKHNRYRIDKKHSISTPHKYGWGKKQNTQNKHSLQNKLITQKKQNENNKKNKKNK